jgi:2-dehydropantoate 2-reductase
VRFVVFGAGAIGGAVGGRLFEAEHDVVLVARGEHYRALSSSGLRIETPVDQVSLPVPVVDHVSKVDWCGDEVVLLAVKSQHTDAALDDLQSVVAVHTPIVCMQNGVENERRAIRRFPNTYAMCVMCPASHMAPGVVQTHSHPVSGLLDLGRYPSGMDETAKSIAGALNETTFDSQPLADIMRWKYCKLLMNLLNAVEALCGSGDQAHELRRAVLAEGKTVLRQAGIDVASSEEDRARRGDLVNIGATASGPRAGGSSWQSLARGTGSIEADYLNGEIALIGALHDVPTPLNSLLQSLANEAAHEGWEPGSRDPNDILAMALR